MKRVPEQIQSRPGPVHNTVQTWSSPDLMSGRSAPHPFNTADHQTELSPGPSPVQSPGPSPGPGLGPGPGPGLSLCLSTSSGKTLLIFQSNVSEHAEN